MDTLKTVALIGCLLGVAFTMLEITIPGDKLKGHVKTVMSKVMLIAILTPFVKEGLVFAVSSDIDASELSQTEDLQKSIDDFYIKETEGKIIESLNAYLLKDGLETDNLCIVTEIDEYNFLEVKKISLKANEKDFEKIEILLKSLVGDKVVIEFPE
ncbi:MAG: hypothetical protein GX896_04450 [Clostridiales bacterium]|nr:hypothetical protein [Clostridiales bacterium]